MTAPSRRERFPTRNGSTAWRHGPPGWPGDLQVAPRPAPPEPPSLRGRVRRQIRGTKGERKGGRLCRAFRHGGLGLAIGFETRHPGNGSWGRAGGWGRHCRDHPVATAMLRSRPLRKDPAAVDNELLVRERRGYNLVVSVEVSWRRMVVTSPLPIPSGGGPLDAVFPLGRFPRAHERGDEHGHFDARRGLPRIRRRSTSSRISAPSRRAEDGDCCWAPAAVPVDVRGQISAAHGRSSRGPIS